MENIQGTQIFKIITDKTLNLNQSINNDEVDYYNTLMKNKEFDVIIFAIENNVPIDILKFLINKFNYNQLNKFTTFNDGEIKSPLFSAIFNGHFKLANFLIGEGADVNYNDSHYTIIQLLISNQRLTAKILKYLLNTNFDSRIVEDYFNSYQFDFELGKTIIEHFVFNNDFILKILYYYKYQIKVSKNKLKNLIDDERYRITIPFQWYQRCIYKSQYQQLIYLSYHEKSFIFKEKIEYIIKSYNDVNLNKFSIKLYEFLLKLKYHKIQIEYDINFINKSIQVILNDKRNSLNNIIKNNDILTLKQFYDENIILMGEINDYYYDILANAITYGCSIEMIDSIVDLFSYSIFNYIIPKSVLIDASPLVHALALSKLDVCSYLVSKGADIGFNFINPDTSLNTVIEFLYFYKLLNSTNLKYILSTLKYNNEEIEKFKIPKRLILEYTKLKKNDLLIIIIKEFVQAEGFLFELYLLALKYNNFEIIDEIFLLDDDPHTKDNVKNIIYSARKLFGSNAKIYSLIRETKNQELFYYLNKYVHCELRIRN